MKIVTIVLSKKKLEAYITSDNIISAKKIINLTPQSGNIHSFSALEDTALLDVLIPNYDCINRYCNYYEEIKQTEFDYSMEIEKVMNGMTNGVEKPILMNGTTNGFMQGKAVTTDSDSAISPLTNNYKKKTTLSYALPDTDMKILTYQYENGIIRQNN